MASIRLFGRGRNAAAAGGPAVGAALIADVLESVAAASMSTTWRCRHSAGVSIGEGAVDFAAGRSRSTVIRGKYAFEYVRSGASVYRAPVTDEGVGVGAGVNASAGARALVDVDEDQDAPESVEGEAFDPELDAEDGDEEDAQEDDGVEFDEPLEAEESQGGDEDDDEDAQAELDAEDEVDEDGEDDGDQIEGGDDGEDGASHEQAASAQSGSGSVSASSAGSVWERFSDHDACGVHAYAEPAVLAAGVRASGVVQARDAEEFDGVKLAAYAVTLKPKPGDPNRVLARLARQLRDHGANVVVVTAFVDQSDQHDDEEDDPKIVRLRIDLPHWTPADDPTADHSVSVDLFEFGEPVSVEVPEGAARRTARTCADLGLF